MRIIRATSGPITSDGGFIEFKTSAGTMRSKYLDFETLDPDDIYHCYNLIAKGDKITASTTRNVSSENASGKVKKERINLNVCIEVKSVQFDQQSCSLRINGTNCEENDYIKLGQYHNIDIGVNDRFKLEKPQWDDMWAEMVREATDAGSKAELAVVVMQEGLANICLVTNYLTLHKGKVEKNIAKKSGPTNNRDKSIDAFFGDVYSNMMRIIDFNAINSIFIASPGFVAESYMKFMIQKATRENNAIVLKARPRIAIAKSSSGHMSAVSEVVGGSVAAGGPSSCGKSKGVGAGETGFSELIVETKAYDNIKDLQKFKDMLAENIDKIAYGKRDVLAAAEAQAIEVLLITDTSYRDPNPDARNEYALLMKSVKVFGGKVSKFSSQHASGKQLNDYSGIAAILRFEFMEPMKPQVDNDANTNTSATAAAGSNHLSVSKRNIFIQDESSDDEFASDSEDEFIAGEPNSGSKNNKKEMALTQSEMWDLEAFL